jgi:hypothetical protein
MNQNLIQYQLSEVSERTREAKKSRGSSTTLIWVGSVSVFISVMFLLFSLFMIATADMNTAGADAANATGGCCTSVSIIMTIIGIVVLTSGLVKRSHANADIAEAAADAKKLQLQALGITEDKSSM